MSTSPSLASLTIPVLEGWPDTQMLNALGDLLQKIQSDLFKSAKRKFTPEDQQRIQEAIPEMLELCRKYQEAILERNQAASIKTMLRDFKRLNDVLSQGAMLGGRPGWRSAVRDVVISMSFESRHHIATLPMSPGAKKLPKKHGKNTMDRFEALKQLWLEADAARLMPPPKRLKASENHLNGIQIEGSPCEAWMTDDPMVAERGYFENGQMTFRNPWNFQPEKLREAVALAEEVLLVETDGIIKARNAIALKSPKKWICYSFAHSALLLYEDVMGLGTAKQSNKHSRGGKPTGFERYLDLLCQLAVGPVCEEWHIGTDPKRRAISTQRAWIKLSRLAGCDHPKAFRTLDPSVQRHYLNMLNSRTRMHLKPLAPTWV